jgi:DNA-binding transcriptional ArsR family regulator
MTNVDDAGLAQLRATAHPLRLQILSLLTGASMSAAELARELGTSQANASYHLRVLAEAGEVQPDGEESIRGGVAKRYRYRWREEPKVKRPQRELAHHLQAMGAEMSRRLSLAKPESKKFFCDAEMWVTPETWEHVVALVAEASALVHDNAQPPRTEATIHVNLQMVAFGMKDQAS